MKMKGICGMCHNRCDIVADIENGKLTQVAADPDSPRGRVCSRGRLAPKIVYSEKRLLYPLVRDGEKGEGKFRRVSWDEALDRIAEGFGKIMEEYGPRALASYHGGSGLEDSMNDNMRFFAHFGSPNDMGPGSICNTSSNLFTPVTTYGIPTPMLRQDIENSEVIFIWGKNPKTDSGPLSLYQSILAAKKRGVKMIVIDPCETGMGEIADLWVPIIPGSDGALAMAMTKLVIERGQYDKSFVRDYTRGFDEYRTYLEGLSMEDLSRYCGVSLETITQLADIFTSTTKIPLVSYTGLEYQLSGVQNNRALQILWAITGKVDVPGGIYMDAYGAETRKLFEPQGEKPIGIEQYPVFCALTGVGQFIAFPNAVLKGEPYPIRGLMIRAASPAVSYPDMESWRNVYRHLDFMVVLDRFMTEDARYADVILPATTLFENDSYCRYPGGIRLRKRFIEPVGEAKPDLFIYQAIAARMGKPDAFPKNKDELYAKAFQGKEELYQKLLEHPEGVAYPKKRIYRKYETGELRADGQKGFPTPSGKFEISSTILEQFGYTGYPVYRDISQEPDLKKDFSFVMTSGNRSPHRYSSFGPNIPELAELDPFPTVDISPADAKQLGISEGDMATVETACGKLDFRARIVGMKEGTIHVFSSGGSSEHSKEWREANVNNLISPLFRDNISGFVVLKSVPCNVSKKTNP